VGEALLPIQAIKSKKGYVFFVFFSIIAQLAWGVKQETWSIVNKKNFFAKTVAFLQAICYNDIVIDTKNEISR
jgi:hypothetical protein